MCESDSRDNYEFDVRFRVFTGCAGIYEIGEALVPCAEIEEVVVGTDTMTFDDYINCRIMDLLVKIFIDSDLFEEVFGLVEWLGLSKFGLIRHLIELDLHRAGGLSYIVDEFERTTKEPLYADIDQLEQRLKEPGVVLAYLEGKQGSNELLGARARAYLEHDEELHCSLEGATQSYLEVNGKLTPSLAEYLADAIRFSRLRKFHPHQFTQDRADTFQYNFVEAQTKRFRVDPETIRWDARVIVFEYKETGLEAIYRTLERWSDGERVNFGKLFQKENLKLMSRHVRPAEMTAAE